MFNVTFTGVSGEGRASNVAYDNTTSGLTANNVQDAIDEVQNEIDDLSSPPDPSDANPQDLGTAAAGSSMNYSRADHIHNKPTYTKADIGLGNVDNVQQYSASNPPPYPVTSVNGNTGAVIVSVPSAYTSNPAMDGDAFSGQSEQWARGDHRHGHDSSKADVTALETETAARKAHQNNTRNPHEVTAAQTRAVSIDVVAPTEDPMEASQAYGVGEYLFLSGVLYKTTIPIEQGDTIIAGTNVTLALLGEDVSSHNVIIGSITFSDMWIGSVSPYFQLVTVTGATVTSSSKIDLQPTAAQIASLISDGVMGLIIENNNGTLTAYSVGAAPSAAMTVQCTVEETI